MEKIRKNLSLIAAVSADGGIGRNGRLLFHIPADMKRFKALTTGHTVVMGRLTFESLPKGALPNRRNIVVTRNQDYAAPGIETAYSIADALQTAGNTDEVFVIGGAQIYGETLPLAGRMYLTVIDKAAPDADAFFPTFDSQDWEEIDRQTFPADGTTPSYAFVTYGRRENGNQ